MNMTSFLEKGYRVLGERNDIRIKKRPAKGSRLAVDTERYKIYEYAYGADRIIAAYGKMIVVQNYRNKNDITLYPYGKSKALLRYRVCLNESAFPGLLPNSEILSCQLIPYMREVDYHKYQKTVRLVVITTKAQIYHNYPARNVGIEGFSQPGDIQRFEESAVWDLPDRKHPSKSRECTAFEKYYPGLPDICYEYHPMANTDAHFVDKYGNGGFSNHTEVEYQGSMVQVSRFYLYSRDAAANPFFFIGTGERNYKLSLMATYRGNVYCGVRTCVFASSDGGRNWYCKYEFADAGSYEFAQGDTDSWGKNFGNAIKRIEEEIDWQRVKIMQRVLCVPDSENKEPHDKFQWIPVGFADHAEQAEQLILELQHAHNLQTGNIVALCTDKTSQSDVWIINNTITPNSSGNQNLFKVEALSDRKIALYELVSNPDNNIPCRHIHHVNRIKDGWIFGTGEIYPNGWLFYLQMKEADTFAIKNAWEEFQIIRLNSSKESVQRTMGGLLFDNKDATFIFASDHDTLERDPAFAISGRKLTASRSSTGIFKGKLADIDNRNLFEAIYEASEPCFYFQNLDHMLIFCGQRGELAVSFNGGETWASERISEPIIRYYGSCGQTYYFDSIILVRK